MIDRRHFSKAEFHAMRGWRRVLTAAAIATMGVASVFLTGAQAAPMSPSTSAGVESQVWQVRDGCGQGMRYSERREACVEDFGSSPRDYDDRRPPPSPMYDRRPPPPEFGRGPDYRGPMPDCGRGMRFSNSRQGCVRIEGAADDRGNNDAATGALIGGVIGGLVGSAIQNDANPQRQGGQPGPNGRRN